MVPGMAGVHLRGGRARRGISQLALATECDVSTRHLSFVETGRSRPSRQLIVHLARFLRPTNRELNACLLAAGYAPRSAPARTPIPVGTTLGMTRWRRWDSNPRPPACK